MEWLLRNIRDTPRAGGCTALELAANNGHAHVVQLLPDKGASPNRRDKHFQRTALIYAAWNRHENVVRVLLAHKDIEPDCENDDGRTALWYVCKYRERKPSTDIYLICS
jgi:ankyrin repeat protein